VFLTLTVRGFPTPCGFVLDGAVAQFVDEALTHMPPRQEVECIGNRRRPAGKAPQEHISLIRFSAREQKNQSIATKAKAAMKGRVPLMAATYRAV